MHHCSREYAIFKNFCKKLRITLLSNVLCDRFQFDLFSRISKKTVSFFQSSRFSLSSFDIPVKYTGHIYFGCGELISNEEKNHKNKKTFSMKKLFKFRQTVKSLNHVQGTSNSHRLIPYFVSTKLLLHQVDIQAKH